LVVAERPHDGSRGIHAPVGVIGTIGCRGATIEICELPRNVVGPINRSSDQLSLRDRTDSHPSQPGVETPGYLRWSLRERNPGVALNSYPRSRKIRRTFRGVRHGVLVQAGEVDVLVAERPHDGSRGIHAPVGVIGTIGCRGATIEICEPPRNVVGPINRSSDQLSLRDRTDLYIPTGR
jgi:hypothetical protein